MSVLIHFYEVCILQIFGILLTCNNFLLSLFLYIYIYIYIYI